MNHWDSYFLEHAAVAASRSKDPSTKVGAVLVKDRRIIATGYNGFPSRIADLPERLSDRETKYAYTVHAEMNALLFAGREAAGATLYVYGFSGAPCENCTKHAIAAGVARVVMLGPEIPARWAPSLGLASKMLAEAGVEISSVTLPR